ncbi:hypothetical protein A3D11_03270 [Candidatus Peribacteria bacterium RIFCSPHIGHO2_02_FULL_49_16]|nr:MAG: hypothetical protein A2880_03140 [Candidatus Peribacteria bacterium RIFCSPHIGHO2_01_FULL_49_38]OGJ59338.1 MAG: hypothetical protein A3D11_03270 [Candidatus Peribacteria bacterium RIFCSPHIGHO2_02_FULL_49_16]
MSRKRKEMWLLIAITLGFFVLSFAIYGVSLNNKFIQWDDGYLIVENPIVQGISLENIKKSFSQYDPELYIPVTFLSYQIDHLLWGMNPFGFHLTNLVLHTMNALLVMMFLFLLLRNVHLSLFVGLLFLVHPLHTEAVAWASARKDVLSSFFFLLSVCGYLLYLPLPKGGAGGGGHPQAFYWGSVIAFALGLLSKVSIIMLPVILLLIEWLFFTTPPVWRRWLRSRMVILWPYFLLSVMFGVVALFGKTKNVAESSLTENILLAGKSTIFYLQTLFWPTNLSPLYPYTDEVSFAAADVLVPFVIVTAITVVSIFFFLFLTHLTYKLFAFSWLFYLLTLTPSFTNFRKGDDIELDLYFASDRYAYIPSIGIIFVLGLLSYSIIRKVNIKMKYAPVFFAGIILPLSVAAHQQSRIWHDTETFFTYVLSAYPNTHIAHINVGILKMKDDPDGAIEEYEKAIAIRQSGRAYYNLGLAYLRKGKKDDAFDAFTTAVEINPLHARAYLNLGVLLVQEGKRKEGMHTIRKAIEAQPNFSLAHENLGVLYEEEGKFNEAKNSYEKALQYDPESVDALIGLANVYINTSQLDKALLILKHAIEIDHADMRYQGMLERIQRMKQ